MSERSSSPGVESAGTLEFWIRRLHSLSGVLPLGVFLIIHLSANASILAEGQFDRNVARIHSLGPLVVPLEVFGILLPLAFHIGAGLWILRGGRMNHHIYRYWSNWRYSLQRVTAWIATVFILYHLYHLHWLGRSLGGGQFDPENATATAVDAIQGTLWSLPIWILYAAGVACTVYHFANGLWTFLITWGVTVGPRAQRVSGAVCGVLGLVLAAVGLGAVFGFQTFRPEQGSPPPAAHRDAGSTGIESLSP